MKNDGSKVRKGTRGVPSGLTLEFVRDWVKPQISERRFRHTEGVVETARELAIRTDCDEFLAQLAAWLHDSRKEIKDKELIKRARDFGLQLHPIEELNGHLLHGPVAAETARAELGLTNKEVLAAIAEHTLGAVDMTTLSKVVFLADAIEPGRSPEYCKPIWQALHPCVWPDEDIGSKSSEDENGEHANIEPAVSAGTPVKEGQSEHAHYDGPIVYGLEALKLTSKLAPDLDKAVLVACDLGLIDLVSSKRYIHPKTVDVRNFYLELIKNRE